MITVNTKLFTGSQDHPYLTSCMDNGFKVLVRDYV